MLSVRTRWFAVLTSLIASLLLAACDGTTFEVGITPPTAPPTTEPQPTATTGDDVTPGETASPTQGAADPTPTNQPTDDPAQPGDDGTPPPATTPPDANGALQSPPADWVTYTSKGYGVTFRVPPGWVLEEGDGERLSGPGGYATLDAVGGEGVAEVMDVCRQQAEHVLRPYGTSPEVQPITAGQASGMPGCLVIPDDDAGMGDEHVAAIAYPQPQTINGLPYDYVVIYATGHHVRAIASSLRFVSQTAQAPTPTPAPTLPPDADPAGTAAGIQRLQVTPLQNVARGAEVQVTWEAQGAQAVLCQEFVRSFGGSGLAANTCQDVALDGSMAITMPEEPSTFYVKVQLLVSAAGGTVDATQTVQLACEHDWFFTANAPTICPVNPALAMNAVAQRFERGWMIYVEDVAGSPLDNLYVAQGEGYVMYQNPSTAETPDSVQPPEGLIAPADRFYTAWDAQGGDQGLGWATGEPVSYQVRTQRQFPPRGTPTLTFMSGPGGQIFALDADENAPAEAGLVGEWYLWGQQ